jgi:hypothetical protein
MEEYRMPINFVASCILTCSFVLFIIFVFGRTNSKIYNLPCYKSLGAKLGLALCTCGSLLNAITFSNPPWSEVCLNSGLAILFSWASWFHYRNFVIPYKESAIQCKVQNTKKKTKKAIKK